MQIVSDWLGKANMVTISERWEVGFLLFCVCVALSATDRGRKKWPQALVMGDEDVVIWIFYKKREFLVYFWDIWCAVEVMEKYTLKQRQGILLYTNIIQLIQKHFVLKTYSYDTLKVT